MNRATAVIETLALTFDDLEAWSRAAHEHDEREGPRTDAWRTPYSTDSVYITHLRHSARHVRSQPLNQWRTMSDTQTGGYVIAVSEATTINLMVMGKSPPTKSKSIHRHWCNRSTQSKADNRPINPISVTVAASAPAAHTIRYDNFTCAKLLTDGQLATSDQKIKIHCVQKRTPT